MRRQKRSLFIGSVLTIATLFITWISPMLLASPAYAAGVAVSATPSELTAASATDVTFSYVSSAEYASGDTITFSFSPVVSAVAACATPDTDADNDATPDGAFSGLSTSGGTYTFNASTTTATTAVSLCLKVTAATGNYSLAMTDNKAVPANNDYGAALLYAGDDNDVLVTAQVQPTLTFAIRNTADDADTNVCPLGVLSLATVKTCAYRLKVSTNADSGYTVAITSNGGLVDGTNDINAVTEGNTVIAGSEGYGVAFVGGSATGGSITEQGDFTDDDTPVPTSPTNLYVSDGNNNPTAPDTTNTALVTHRAAIDANTSTGNYSQTVTYTVTASF
ncbi:MAG TPA: hypothetical protein PLL26_02825 [Candidatus Dojkabacteria bacterium]|nr:hypothetical protein [Candidatus Dojkabacteria bacterium]